MTSQEVVDTVLSAVRAKQDAKTLVVDDRTDTVAVADRLPNAVRLSATSPQTRDLWELGGQADKFDVVVISSDRPACDLLAVCELAAPLVAAGGSILLLPSRGGLVTENRVEVTEVFLGVNAGWARQQADSHVVTLTKERDNVRRRGVDAGKRVVSLAAFGDYASGDEIWRSMPGFISNRVLAHATLFGGWELRFHVDDALARTPVGAFLAEMETGGHARVVKVAQDGRASGKCRAMLWRLMPAWDREVGLVVCRDVDDLPTRKDRRACDEWAASATAGETDAWTLHDSASHAGMMGGLCGFTADFLRRVATSFDALVTASGFTAERWSNHGADQDFINSKIARRARVFEHSVFEPLVSESGERRRRSATDWGGGKRSSVFKTTVADASAAAPTTVGRDTAALSDTLTNHLGTAGYDVDKARKYWDAHSPIAAAVRAAEERVGLG